MTEIDPLDLEPRPLPRAVRIIAGVVLAPLALVCTAGSLVLIVQPQTDNPLVAMISGLVLVFVSLWVLGLAVRLIFNSPNRRSLLGPWALRIVALYMVALPIYAFVSGEYRNEGLMFYYQAASFLIGAPFIWLLARKREKRNFGREV